jgi:hypothetical protein
LPLDEQGSGPVAVTVEDMKELMAMNARGEVPASLSDFAIEEEHNEIDDVYSNVVGQDSLNRFDEKRRRSKKRRNPKGNPSGSNRSGGGGAAPSGERAAAPAGPKTEASSPQGAAEKKGGSSGNRNRNRSGRNRSGRNRGGNKPAQANSE